MLRISDGITPAYAGKSVHLQRNRTRLRDHPRVCGEKPARSRARRRNWGSPPRMRGKDREDVRNARVLRITPAYAGKRDLRTGKGINHEDHPRVCGEKLLLFLFHVVNQGSPPRMRGKGFACGRCPVLEGITPAYAGKSSTCCRWRSGKGDHPRVCGEKTKKIP